MNTKLHSLFTLFAVVLLAGCTPTTGEQPQGLEEEVEEVFNGPGNEPCIAIADCLVDHCSPQPYAHEAREAAWFSGCYEVCTGTRPLSAESLELERHQMLKVWQCESGAIEWDDSCDELANYCRGPF